MAIEISKSPNLIAPYIIITFSIYNTHKEASISSNTSNYLISTLNNMNSPPPTSINSSFIGTNITLPQNENHPNHHQQNQHIYHNSTRYDSKNNAPSIAVLSLLCSILQCLPLPPPIVPWDDFGDFSKMSFPYLRTPNIHAHCTAGSETKVAEVHSQIRCKNDCEWVEISLWIWYHRICTNIILQQSSPVDYSISSMKSSSVLRQQQYGKFQGNYTWVCLFFHFVFILILGPLFVSPSDKMSNYFLASTLFFVSWIILCHLSKYDETYESFRYHQKQVIPPQHRMKYGSVLLCLSFFLFSVLKIEIMILLISSLFCVIHASLRSVLYEEKFAFQLFQAQKKERKRKKSSNYQSSKKGRVPTVAAPTSISHSQEGVREVKTSKIIPTMNRNGDDDDDSLLSDEEEVLFSSTIDSNQHNSSSTFYSLRHRGNTSRSSNHNEQK